MNNKYLLILFEQSNMLPKLTINYIHIINLEVYIYIYNILIILQI